MRKKRLPTIILLVLMFVVCHANAQSILIIKKADNTQQAYNLSDIQKLTFSDTNLVVNVIDGTTPTLAKSEVKSIVFNNENSGIGEDLADETKVIVFPNPSSDFIYVETNKEEASEITIYNTQGQLVIRAKMPSGYPINISSLVAGVYVLKVENQTIKLLKK